MSLQSKPPTCRGCPAEHYGQGFVQPSGPPEAEFLIVGPGPGEDDAYQNQAYWSGGATGDAVTRRLYRAGLQRSDVIFTDLVWCWLPDPKREGRRGNRLPTQAEIQHCWAAHLGPYLDSLPAVDCGPRHVFTLGLPPLRWFKGLGPKAPAEVHLGTTELHEMPTATKIQDN